MALIAERTAVVKLTPSTFVQAEPASYLATSSSSFMAEPSLLRKGRPLHMCLVTSAASASALVGS